MQTLCSGIESAHIRVNFFSFKIEETYTLTKFVDHKLSLSQSILTRHMIVWSAWHSSIWKNYWKKYRTAGHLVFWKSWPVTGHIAAAFTIFQANFSSVLRGNHTSSISYGPEIYVSCIYQKLNITALQNCLNWCLIRDMVGQVNVVFSWSFLKPIL